MFTLKFEDSKQSHLREVTEGEVNFIDCTREGYWMSIAYLKCVKGNTNPEVGMVNLDHDADDTELPTCIVSYPNGDETERFYLYSGQVCYIMNDKGTTIQSLHGKQALTLGHVMRRGNDEVTLRDELRSYL